jgi:hypothetical protein
MNEYSWIDEIELIDDWIDNFYNIYLFHLHAFSTLCFFSIRSTIVSKHSLHVKRQARDRYGRFSSPSSRTAPPPSRQEVGSSSRHHTAPPSRKQEVGTSCHHRTAPLLLPPPTRTTRWRCGWRLLLLRHVFGCAPTFKRWAHIEHSF